MAKKFLIFFEIDKVNVERFYFNRIDINIYKEEIVIIIEDYDEYIKFRLEYPNIKIFLFKEWINRVSKNYRNATVFINGNRIPDLLMTKISRQNGCKVVFIQHGMFTGFMKRDILFFVKKIFKSIRYASYAFKLRKPLTLFKIHVQGHSRKLINKSDNLYPDYLFVYSNYWIRWHQENYFFDEKLCYFLLKNNDSKQNIIKKENSIVYCYQTLIEDGRINPDYFFSVLDNIIKIANKLGYELIVKGHPRMSTYTSNYFKKNNIQVIFKKLPVGSAVIGHYSTLLARWSYEKCPVIIVKLEGHKTPKTLDDLSYGKCKVNVLEDILLGCEKLNYDKLNEFKDLSNFYFNFSGNSSVENINQIMKLIDFNTN